MKNELKALIFATFALALISSGAFAAAPTINDFSIANSVGTPIEATKTTDITFNLSASGDTNSVCFAKTESGCASISEYTLQHKTNYTLSETSLNLSDGNNTFYVSVRDSNGETLTKSSMGDWVIYDTTSPALSASYPSENGDYNSSTLAIDLNVTDNYSTIGVPVIKLDTNIQPFTTTTITNGKKFSFTASGLAEGTHTITIDVNDSLTNNLNTSYSFRVDLTAPTSGSITSSNMTSYTNSSTPTFTVSATDSRMDGGQIALSCKSNGLSYVRTYSTSITDFNVLSSSYDCNTADGNKVIYAKFRDKAGNWASGTASTNVLIDRTPPSAPSGLVATAGNGQVELDWDAPSADNLSGNAGYRVYKNGSTYATVTDTNKNVTGLTNGTTYTFKVTAVDNAGNESTPTPDVNSTPSAGPAANITLSIKRSGITPAYVKNGDSLTVKCEFSYDVNSATIYYKYYNPTQSQQTLEGPTNETDLIQDTLTLGSGYERIDFWCAATQYGSTIESSTIILYYDNTLPSIEWKDANGIDWNAEWSGTKTVSVTASDNKEMDVVEFSLGTVKSAGTKSGTTYSYAINTKDYNNGAYTLTATAKDRAGNTASTTKTITIHNILTATQMAEEAIAQAKAKKIIVEDLIKFFATEGLAFPAELLAEKNSADQLLKDAEATKNSDGNGAAVKANSAKNKYSEINGKATINPQQTKFYEYDANSLEMALQTIGLNPAQVAEAAGLIKGTNVARKLVIVRIGNDANAGYQAKIEITFTSDTNDEVLKIVEVIPKEFAQSAAKIISDYNFTIIKDDPIIEFSAPVTKGKSVKITYGIGNITKEQADALVSNNVIAKFSGPPIVLSESTDVKGTLGGFTFPDISGILLWISIILAALIIIGAIAFVLMKKKGGPFLGKNSSIIEKVSDKIVMPENKQGEEKKSWEHK